MREYVLKGMGREIFRSREKSIQNAIRTASRTRVSLRQVFLYATDLRNTEFVDLDLADANFGKSNLQGARFRRCNLHGATFYDSNMEGASLRACNLMSVYFSGANMESADISDSQVLLARFIDANLAHAKLPAPSSMFAANWDHVSDGLCRDLMRWDAMNHPNPKRFDKWANGGTCPYSEQKVVRAANFRESADVWKPGKITNPHRLMVKLLAECAPPWSHAKKMEFLEELKRAIRRK